MALSLTPLKRADAEERVDFKTLYYAEDGNRMTVWEPSVQVEKDLSSSLTIRVNGVYNVISGASPTGAPATTTYENRTRWVAVPSNSGATSSSSASNPTVNSSPTREPNDDAGEVGEDHRLQTPSSKATYLLKAGATPTASPTPTYSPAPSTTTTTPTTSSSNGSGSTVKPVTDQVAVQKVPTAQSEDTRIAFDVELIKKLDRQALSAQVALSQENDYTSLGLALKDAIEFNEKNTTLLLGISANNDSVEGSNLPGSESKHVYDVMAGVTQVVGPNTLFTANLTLGRSDGYLSDPYKVADVNGALVPENRPDSRTRSIGYLSLTHFFESLNGSAEGSFRLYNDSFGIISHTLGLAWYQKINPQVVLRPAIRMYSQSEADFYDVRFSGSQEFYSADYRLSALNTFSYGLKVIWTPNPRWSFDLSVDRYDMSGTDGKTPDDAYAGATLIIGGVRLWL